MLVDKIDEGRHVCSVNCYIKAVTGTYKQIEDALHQKQYVTSLFFRGQDTDHKLLPPVMRSIPEAGKRYEGNLMLTLRDQLNSMGLSYGFIRERLDMLIHMEHYGIETRLLDWMVAPLVALYFAVKNCRKKTYKHLGGMVYILKPWLCIKDILIKAVANVNVAIFMMLWYLVEHYFLQWT